MVDVCEGVADERAEARIVDLHVEDRTAGENMTVYALERRHVAVDPGAVGIVPTTWKLVSSVGPAATPQNRSLTGSERSAGG